MRIVDLCLARKRTQWVTEQNREHTSRGQLTLHTAHPADTSDGDAYVVFQPVKGVWVPDS
jgi:hypothetical protein